MGIVLILLVEGVGAAAAESGSEKRKYTKKHLKFRSGPICMCSGGLSEKDILEGQQRWLRSPGVFKIQKPSASDNKQEEE